MVISLSVYYFNFKNCIYFFKDNGWVALIYVSFSVLIAPTMFIIFSNILKLFYYLKQAADFLSWKIIIMENW